MPFRIVGVISLLIGGALVAVAIYALSRSESMIEIMGPMAASSGLTFDPLHWSARWTTANLVLAGVGTLTLAGGVTLMFKKVWGLLLVAAAATVTAVFPWALKLFGAARYAFEAPNVVESLVCGAIAIVTSLTYVLGRQQRVGT